jgi:NADH-quinone oxidoreductase subunit M
MTQRPNDFVTGYSMTTDFPILSIIIFLPLLGGFLALCFPGRPGVVRWTSLWVALVDLLLVALLFTLNLQSQAGPSGKWLLAEDYLWIEALGIRYSLGLDGISLMLILLNAFLTILCILVSWKEINTGVGTFHFFLLFMETSIMGVFLATDLFLFYLFWEVQVIPMFFLIGIWGHEERV